MVLPALFVAAVLPHSIPWSEVLFVPRNGVSVEVVAAKVAPWGRVVSRLKDTPALRVSGRLSLKVAKDRLATLGQSFDYKLYSNPRINVEQASAQLALAQRMKLDGKRLGRSADYYGFWKNYVIDHADVNGFFDEGIWERGQTAKDRMGQFRAMAPGSTSWTYVGPKDLRSPGNWAFGPGRVSGRVSCIAPHPTLSSTIYIGTSAGGVFKTTNSGLGWTPLSDNWTNMTVSSLAVHPTNPNIILAGTGDHHGLLRYTGQIMRSEDGGGTWVEVLSGPVPVTGIAFDPSDPTIVIATTGAANYPATTDDPTYLGKVYRSTNAGALFTIAQKSTGGNMENADFSSLSIGIARADGTRTYWISSGQVSGDTFSSIWRSSNKGATWVKSTSPWTGTVNDVAASKVNPEVAYLLVPRGNRLYKTTTNGASWTSITGGFYPTGTNWNQKFYDHFLGVSALDGQDNVFVGLITVSASEDSGATWRDISYGYTGAEKSHVDQHSFAVSPIGSGTMYVGNDGGVYRLSRTFTDVGFDYSFASLNNYLYNTTFNHIAVHPTDPNWFAGGTQDDGTPTARGSLAFWNVLTGGDGMGCDFDPTDPTRLATSSQPGNDTSINRQWIPIYITQGTVTTDVSFNVPLDSCNFETPVRYLSDGKLATAYNGGFSYRTSFWNHKSAPFTGFPRVIEQVYWSVTNKPLVAVGDGINLWMSDDLGSTWEDQGWALPNRTISAVCFNKNNVDDVIVVFSGSASGASSIYRSTNFTTTASFSRLDGDAGSSPLPSIPLYGIQRDPHEPNTLYVASDVGVFISTDMGLNWTNMTEPYNLPNTLIRDLRIGNGYLYAGTFGRGAWRVQVKQLGISLTTTLSSVYGGTPTTGTVTLSSPAPPGGQVVTIDDGNTSAANAPDSLIVPAGSYSKTFTITTSPVQTDRTVTISAKVGNSTASRTLTVKKPILTGFGIQSSAIGSDYLPMTLTLSSPSYYSGQIVYLSDNSASLSTPYSVNVPGSQNSYSGQIQSLPVSANTVVTVTATLDSISLSRQVTLKPGALASLSFPATVFGLDEVEGTVTLNGPAPTSVNVEVWSYNNHLPLPTNNTIPAGGTSATFLCIVPHQVNSFTEFVKAKLFSVTKSVAVTILPELTALSISPTTVEGGASATGTVTRAGGPWATSSVRVSDNNSATNPPTTVTFGNNQTAATFSIPTTVLSSVSVATVYAKMGTTTKTSTLTMRPGVSTIGLSPTTVRGGQAFGGTITMNGADTITKTVFLTSSEGRVTVPPSLSLRAGATLVSFVNGATTIAAISYNATIGARYLTITKTATLTITP